MKKAITILAILAIVAGAVFAENLPENNASETHQIRLKTVVGSVLPQFRLVAQEAQNEASAQTNTGETPVKFTDGAYYGEDGAIVYTVKDISENNIDVTFTAKLLNEAKTGGKYTLDFQAGSFTDVWKVEDGIVTKDNNVPVKTETLTAASGETAAKTGLVIGEPSNKRITVKFNGQECVKGDLANYHVVYEKDPTVVDNNGVGYFADVKLTITFDGVTNPQPQNP